MHVGEHFASMLNEQELRGAQQGLVQSPLFLGHKYIINLFLADIVLRSYRTKGLVSSQYIIIAWVPKVLYYIPCRYPGIQMKAIRLVFHFLFDLDLTT